MLEKVLKSPMRNTLLRNFSPHSSLLNPSRTISSWKDSSLSQPLFLISKIIFQYHKSISENSFKARIQQLSDNKPSGFDKIPNFAFKQLPKTVTEQIERRFNAIRKTHHFSQSWKISKSVPIPKPQTNKTDDMNCRTIHLLHYIQTIRIYNLRRNYRLLWRTPYYYWPIIWIQKITPYHTNIGKNCRRNYQF